MTFHVDTRGNPLLKSYSHVFDLRTRNGRVEISFKKYALTFFVENRRRLIRVQEEYAGYVNKELYWFMVHEIRPTHFAVVDSLHQSFDESDEEDSLDVLYEYMNAYKNWLENARIVADALCKRGDGDHAIATRMIGFL